MGFEFIGDVLILLVPKIVEKPVIQHGTKNGANWQSPDEHTVELKTSEYWQLKESQQAAPAAKAA